jgi:hypothetical protein
MLRRTQKASPGPAAQSQKNDPLRSLADRKPLAPPRRYGRRASRACSTHVEPGCCCGTSDAGWRPAVAFTVEAIWGSILHAPDSKPALICATGSKNDPKPGKNGNSGHPLFPKSHLPVFSLFSLCYLLLEKLSKSLIPLSDCPFVLNRLPVFLGKYPCFPEKTGWAHRFGSGTV